MRDIMLLNPPLVNYDVRQKVRLLDPSGSHLESLPPLGLCYIASTLEEAGFGVVIVDMDNEKIGPQGILSHLRKHEPRIVGLSVTTSTYPLALKTAGVVKSWNINAMVVFGGIHPTLLPEQCLDNDSVDIVVRGEGEVAMKELANSILRENVRLDDILGISYKRDHKPINNPRRPVNENLDLIPFPARHLLKNDRYFVALAKSNPTAAIIGSRGCPFECIFCSKAQREVRYRSPANIVDEIEQIISGLGIREIAFYDDTFNVHGVWGRKICIELLKRKVKIDWRCRFRVTPIDRTTLALMRKAGCYMISFGVEASSNHFLRLLKKGVTVEQIRKAFKLAQSVGFETHAYFLTGIPGETKGDISRTISFAKELRPDFASFFIPAPFPGTELREMAINNGWLKGTIDAFDEKDHFHAYGWHETHLEFPSIASKDVEELRSRAFGIFYTNPSTIMSFAMKTLKNPRRICQSIGFVIRYGL